MLSLLERGKYGYYLTNLTSKDDNDQETNSAINFMEKRSKNGLSVTQLLGEGEHILKKCFGLCRAVL